MEKSCADCGRRFTAKRLAAKYCSDLCRKRAQRRKSPRLAEGPPAAARGPGPVERAVRADIAAMITAHPAGEALAEMSYALARRLDAGTDGAPAVNRELRANLAELGRLAVDDGDELADELSAPELSPEVRDSEDA